MDVCPNQINRLICVREVCFCSCCTTSLCLRPRPVPLFISKRVLLYKFALLALTFVYIIVTYKPLVDIYNVSACVFIILPEIHCLANWSII